jgi:hypothetical protein
MGLIIEAPFQAFSKVEAPAVCTRDLSRAGRHSIPQAGPTRISAFKLADTVTRSRLRLRVIQVGQFDIPVVTIRPDSE